MTGPSFLELLRTHAPDSLPARLPRDPAHRVPADLRSPHGTTIIAFTWADGVLLAGDRRATAANVIAQKDLVKVMTLDGTSAVGFAGSVGHALHMLTLFATEVEQYEKIEGAPISLDGKIQRLAAVMRENLGAAMQGFVALPLLVGYDPTDPDPARIVTYDPTGSVARNRSGYTGIGSGSDFATASLKKRHRPDADRAGAIAIAVEALWDAADGDTATGGPDLTRSLFPNLITVTAAGTEEIPEPEVRAATEALPAARSGRPAHR